MKKLFIALFLVAMFTNMAWAVSTNTGSVVDMGLTDPRIYGGASDTMKQSTTHTAGVDTLTLTVTAGYIEMASNASSSLAVTMTETGAIEGDRTVVCNIGSGSVVFTDQAGILNVASTSMTMGAEDTLSLMYTGTIWVETSRSDN